MSTLPEHYGDDRLVTLLRDPTTIFVYWELEGGARATLRDQLGEPATRQAFWILRVKSVETGAVADTSIDVDARNWYLSVLPDNTYEVQLGLKTATGEFHPALALVTAHTPPLSYSQLADRQWPILEEDYRRLLSLGWTGQTLGSSGVFAFSSQAEEAPWVTVEPDAPAEPSAPTSPGAPAYRERR